MNTTVKFQHFSRVANALMIASVVTFLLLLLMNFLISNNDLQEPPETKRIDLESVFYKEVKIIPQEKEIEEVDDPMDPPEMPMALNHSDEVDLTSFTGEGFQASTRIEGLDSLVFDSDTPVRLVSAPPEYPQRAITRNIQGYVDIQFDIEANGTTSNLIIIDYQPSSIFNRSVQRAVARWKYTPKMHNGKPVAVRGVLERVSFALED